MTPIQTELHFDGKTYEPEADQVRLGKQLTAVKTLMLDGEWRTLQEICDATGTPSQASVSARIRDLRKERFGSFTIDRQARGNRTRGLFEYRVAK